MNVVEITNIAAYHFAELADLKPLRQRLLGFCKERGLKGTILLSTEGVNLFVAGESGGIEELLAELRAVPGLEALQPKYSSSAHQPFSRMLVRVKKEIIAFGVEGIRPGIRTSPKLSPATLKQWLDEGRRVTLLDTRNDYEVKLGTFRGAIPAGIDHFRDFPKAVDLLPDSMKDEAVVMFCTGGIRCEKAGPYMESRGFRNIHQLDGGILKYFEECGGAHYDGECFVFDQRVGVDPALRETSSAQCYRCLAPLTGEEQEDPRYIAGKSCPYCHKSTAQQMVERIAEREEAVRRAVSPLPGSAPYENRRPVRIPLEQEGKTLIKALGSMFPHTPHAEWVSFFDQGNILDPEGNPAVADRVVRAGERYARRLSGIVEPSVDAGIRILHEDEALIVVNKPAPLPIHPCGRFNRNTLQSILQTAYHPEKPRPAHRLDANTTGVVVFTRARRFAKVLQPEFEMGRVEKTYLVQVQGHPVEEEFECDAPIGADPIDIGGREVDAVEGLAARTRFRVLASYADGTSTLEAVPLTGRTNQIRLHLWHLGYAVYGDPLYRAGGILGSTQTLGIGDPPMCLHAWRLSFRHPIDNETVVFEAPLPDWDSVSK
jgi:RluA family pseudouridine synthase